MDRRTFLLRAVQLAGGLSVLRVGASCRKEAAAPANDAGAAALQPSKPYVPQFFTEPEVAVLGVVLARLFPSDNGVGAPDAAGAHLIEYIDRQLLEPHFASLHRMMRTGLLYLDKLAMREQKQPFVALTTAQQDDILGRFQVGSVRGMTFPQERFFDTLHSFALEGYWGDPKYGGNADKIVWRWAGIDPGCGGHIFAGCGG